MMKWISNGPDSRYETVNKPSKLSDNLDRIAGQRQAVKDKYPAKLDFQFLGEKDLPKWMLNWFDPQKIESTSAEKKWKMTYCARTAAKNWEQFGIEMPRGNAINLYKQTPGQGMTWSDLLNQIKSSSDNVFHITTDNLVKWWVKSWHAFVAFKWNDWQLYCLDPYHGWTQPMLLSSHPYLTNPKYHAKFTSYKWKLNSWSMKA